MKLIVILLLLLGSQRAAAQVESVSLQAAGLTCSMCSKAVKTALEAVPQVASVGVNLKSQEYELKFKEGVQPDLDALAKAVDGSGFSVASLKVTARMPEAPVAKGHLNLGGQYFHFIKGTPAPRDGKLIFRVVDKGFLSEKEGKKFGAAAAGHDCSLPGAAPSARMYHAVI